MAGNLMVLLSPKNMILFMIIFTRLGGLMTSAPLFSTFPIPPHIKAWLVATITFIIFPFVAAKSGFHMPSSVPELTMVLLKEFIIGYIIGFLANLIFIGIEMASDIISVQMGLSMAQALDPATHSNVPVLAQAYNFIGGLVFLGLNAHHHLFSAVYKSFQTVPIGYDFILNGFLTKEIMFMSGQIFAIGFSIALPIFAVLLMTDVLLGFTAKMMPQMNVFLVAIPLKIYIGMMLVLMLLRPTTEHIATIMGSFYNVVTGLF